jgi:casein kinase II subunit beta
VPSVFSFNLTGLQHLIPYFDYALDMILDVEAGEALSDDQQEMIENDAENLFGLIHARYILTTRGLQAMLEKYRLFHFGRCPRIYCRGQACLPIGISDVPNEEAVKLYWSVAPHTNTCTSVQAARRPSVSFPRLLSCLKRSPCTCFCICSVVCSHLFSPKCEDIYHTRSTRHEQIDGAYFGTTFPHLFFLTFPELKPVKGGEAYVPRVFGFQIHHTAYKASLETRRKQTEQQAQLTAVANGGVIKGTPAGASQPMETAGGEGAAAADQQQQQQQSAAQGDKLSKKR